MNEPTQDEIKARFTERVNKDPEILDKLQERIAELPTKETAQQELPPVVTLTDPRAEILSMVSRTCSIPVEVVDIEAANRMTDILEILGENAVAIAAPQIGVLKRIFVMRLANGSYRSFFNPVIKGRSSALSHKPEGCLSVTGASVRVSRPRSVTLEYIDITGNLCLETFSGLYARAVCHEVDHLNGHIIMEHMAKEIEHKTRILNIKKEEKLRRTSKRRAKNKLAQQANRRNRR